MTTHLVTASLGFPAWLRMTHFINLLFIGLLIRSGIQILGAHPRFYCNDTCKPTSAWLNLTRRKVPKDQLYTSMDDEIAISPWLAQPGGKNLGLGRHWHFFAIICWVLNGLIYVLLLFTTGEWSRLIPTSWDIVPRAWQTLLTYLSLHIPPTSDFRPYDPLQQLTYAAVVFLLGPFMLLTGATMSPAIEARFPWYIKLFGGRQSGRSLHFLAMLAFVAFIVVHTLLVLIVHFQDNIRNIVLGSVRSSLTLAVTIAIIALLGVFVLYALTSWYSLRHQRQVQDGLGAIVDPIRKGLLHRITSRQDYQPSAISSYFWVNGRPPISDEFKQLQEQAFSTWKLEVSGLVTNPLQLSLEDMRTLSKQTQITKHNCIQGWSAVAQWGGVPVREVLALCGALPEARYLVFNVWCERERA